MRRNSGIIGDIRKVAKSSPNEAKISDTYDQYTYKRVDNWPDAKEITLMRTSAGSTAHTHNQIVGFDITGKGWDAAAETLYWTVNIPSTSGIISDIFNSLSGSFTMATDNTGSFTIGFDWWPNRDQNRNGSGVSAYDLEIRSGSTSGPILGSQTFTVPQWYIIEARIQDGSTVNSEGAINAYWQWRSTGANNAATGNIIINYEPRYLFSNINEGQTSSGSTNCVVTKGIGQSTYPYYVECTPNVDTVGGTFESLFKWVGGSSTLEYTLAVNNNVIQADGDFVQIQVRNEGAGSWTTIDTLNGYGPGGSASKSGTFAVSEDQEVRIHGVNYSGTSGFNIEGTRLFVQNGQNNYRSTYIQASEITGEETNIAVGGYLSGSTLTDYFNIDSDLTTEGVEDLYVWWYTNQTVGGSTEYYFLGWDKIQINDTSTNPNISVSTSSTSISEGDSVTFTITDTNSSQNGTFYYTLESQTGGITSADFSTAISGSFTMSNGSATLVMTTLVNDTGEGTENFRVVIRQGSTSGTILAGSSYVSIANVLPNITNDIISIPSVNVIYDPSNSDYLGAFDVLDVNVPSGYSGTAAIYMGLRVTTATTFYNDICIGGVQVLNSNGNSILDDYIFYTSNGGTGSGWRTLNGQFADSTTRSTLSSSAVSVITTSTNVGGWTWATSTGSSTTGAADGISSIYISALLPSPGNNLVAQSGGSYYAYRETSGSSRFTTAWAKSPSRTWNGGEIIRICYHFSTNSSMSTSVDPNDSIRITLI
jgi:hypothetical protein